MPKNTWTPDSGTDSLTFADMNSSPGIYGDDSDTPAIATLWPGLSVRLDASLNFVGSPLVSSDFPADALFRRLAGKFTITS